MSKIIVSPATHWPGKVTIADPLTFPQALEIEKVLSYTIPEEAVDKKGMVNLSVTDIEILPAIQICVEKWELENFNPDPFPASPRKATHELIMWLFNEIITVYDGERESPNE